MAMLMGFLKVARALPVVIRRNQLRASLSAEEGGQRALATAGEAPQDDHQSVRQPLLSLSGTCKDALELRRHVGAQRPLDASPAHAAAEPHPGRVADEARELPRVLHHNALQLHARLCLLQPLWNGHNQPPLLCTLLALAAVLKAQLVGCEVKRVPLAVGEALEALALAAGALREHPEPPQHSSWQPILIGPTKQHLDSKSANQDEGAHHGFIVVELQGVGFHCSSVLSVRDHYLTRARLRLGCCNGDRLDLSVPANPSDRKLDLRADCQSSDRLWHPVEGHVVGGHLAEARGNSPKQALPRFRREEYARKFNLC
mmetsp:Transcript_16479/g.48268  ORF Transcript_16479/g.48268 Transcript_16479/m.48268 type:complete len:315 (+) Transcript_16479:1149-2093(+)